MAGQQGIGSVAQELQGVTPVVRVCLVRGDHLFEDVAVLSEHSYENAVLRATCRAIGYPDRTWQFTRVCEVGGDTVDPFATVPGSSVRRGVHLAVVDPDGVHRECEFNADLAWPNRTLLMAHAFAAIAAEYYGSKGIEARPLRPERSVAV